MSGAQHATTGPAERPTRAAQSQLHTAADLRRGEKHRNRSASAILDPRLPHFPATRNTEWTALLAAGERGERAGKPSSCPRPGAGAVALRVAISARTFGRRSERSAPGFMSTHSQQFARTGRRGSRSGAGERPFGRLFGPSAADRSQN